MMDILGALTVVRQTLDITKELRNIDGKISDAEFKLKIADLMERVLEVQGALTDAQEREREMLKEIVVLKDKVSLRVALRYTNGLLYEINEAGENVGDPYCNLCHVRHDKLFRMRFLAAEPGFHERYSCDNCHLVVNTGPALPEPQLNRRKSWMS